MLRNIIIKYNNCSQKEENFLLSNVNFKIPHFYIIWKILKNPIVGRSILAGYNWILALVSIFVGHHYRNFAKSSMLGRLLDTQSLVKLLEKKIDANCFHFTVVLKSLYTNIPVQPTIKVQRIIGIGVK